jgi:hypothetical protein
MRKIKFLFYEGKNNFYFEKKGFLIIKIAFEKKHQNYLKKKQEI